MLRRKHTVETPRDRLALAHDAGIGKVSGISVLSGAMVAYGSLAVMLAIVGSAAAAIGISHDVRSRHFHTLSLAGAIVLGLVLFVSYLFGGYVAGRMARRGGAANGLMVFVLGLVVALVFGALLAGVGGTDNIARWLRDVDLPDTWSRWRDISLLGGIACLAAMLVGSMFGGMIGERWHTKLLTRALDPEIGPEARTRHDAASSIENADVRHTSDDVDVRDHTQSDHDEQRLADAQREEVDQVARDQQQEAGHSTRR